MKHPAVHVASNTSKRVNKAGEERLYRSVLLRQSFREDGKVKHRTLANLSSLPEHTIDTLRASLKGQRLVDPTAAWVITRSLPHGHVKAVEAMATGLGLQQLLGPAGLHRAIMLALITAGMDLQTLVQTGDCILDGRYLVGARSLRVGLGGGFERRPAAGVAGVSVMVWRHEAITSGDHYRVLRLIIQHRRD